MLPGKLGHEVIEQNLNVAYPLAQWGNLQGDDIQPIIQITPEFPAADLFLKVGIGCGNDPDIDVMGRCFTHRLNLACFQET